MYIHVCVKLFWSFKQRQASCHNEWMNDEYHRHHLNFSKFTTTYYIIHVKCEMIYKRRWFEDFYFVHVHMPWSMPQHLLRCSLIVPIIITIPNDAEKSFYSSNMWRLSAKIVKESDHKQHLSVDLLCVCCCTFSLS